MVAPVVVVATEQAVEGRFVVGLGVVQRCYCCQLGEQVFGTENINENVVE